MADFSIDYGVYDDEGQIIKRPQFCALSGKLVTNAKRTTRIAGTQLFFITDSTINMSADDMARVSEAIIEHTSDDKPKSTRKSKSPKSSDVAFGYNDDGGDAS